MSLRMRLTLVTALAVGATAVIVSAIAYFLVDDRLRDEFDDTLEGSAVRIAELEIVPELALGFLESPVPGPRYYYAVVLPDGEIHQPDGQEFPFSAVREELESTNERATPAFVDLTADGESFRMAAAPGTEGRTVVVARSLSEVQGTIDALRAALLIVAGVAVAVAASIALLMGRALMRPVTRLTLAAEHVAATQDLRASIDVRRHDELGRLATSVNAMLAALDASRQQQQRLVTDAEHELGTPLTSLRTNAEVLARQGDMPAAERHRVLGEMTGQLEELTRLTDDLVELARDHGPRTEEPAEIQLDELVISAVERTRPRAPNVVIDVLELEPTRVRGQPWSLERALVNLLDNACKWSPPDSRVEVRLVDGSVTIRDHGDGIDPADLPHVFDRFYRAQSARSAPGSGLGLAIVRRVVEDHEGSVHLEPAEGGGTVASLTLPTVGSERAPAGRRRRS